MIRVVHCIINNGAASAVHCFPEPDPSPLELFTSLGLPTWVDPMLNELVVRQPIPAAASQSIVGGHSFPDKGCPVDDGLTFVIICARAAPRHATAGATA